MYPACAWQEKYERVSFALQYSTRRPSSTVVGVSRISYYSATVLILPQAYLVNSRPPSTSAAPYGPRLRLLLTVTYVATSPSCTDDRIAFFGTACCLPYTVHSGVLKHRIPSASEYVR